MPKIGPQKQDVFMHFYSVPVKDKNILAATPEAVNCTINLFVRGTTKRSTKLQLLNSLQFYNWSKMVREGDNVVANLLWLAPATKQSPVINLGLNASGAMYGLWRHDVLLIFNRGIEQSPVEEKFFSAAYSDSSEGSGFYALDARGLMLITTSYSRRVVDAEGLYSSDVNTNRLHWNVVDFTRKCGQLNKRD